MTARSPDGPAVRPSPRAVRRTTRKRSRPARTTRIPPRQGSASSLVVVALSLPPPCTLPASFTSEPIAASSPGFFWGDGSGREAGMSVARPMMTIGATQPVVRLSYPSPLSLLDDMGLLPALVTVAWRKARLERQTLDTRSRHSEMSITDSFQREQSEKNSLNRLSCNTHLQVWQCIGLVVVLPLGSRSNADCHPKRLGPLKQQHTSERQIVGSQPTD